MEPPGNVVRRGRAASLAESLPFIALRRSAAYPSRTDVELAFFPDTLYLIVSIADRDAPDIRAFRLSRGAPEGEQIHEEEVLIG